MSYRCTEHQKRSMVLQLPQDEGYDEVWMIAHKDGTSCGGPSIMMENGKTYTIGQVKRMREIGTELEAKKITTEQAMKQLLEI